MKQCTKCKQIKEFTEFYKVSKKDTYRASCKICMDSENKQYRIDNPESVAENHAQWLKDNAEHMSEYFKKYAKDHREHKNSYYLEYRKGSLNAKIAYNLRSRLYSAVKHGYKAGSAVRDLGCTIDEFKLYMESLFYPNPITKNQMSWKNYGKGPNKWQYDHIIALCLVDLSNPDIFKQVNHFTNIKPFWHENHKIKTAQDRRKLRNK